jgi:long-chain acyl-CoA synthetase
MLSSLGQTLPAAAKRFADKTALVFDGKPTTYRELDQLTDGFAHGLKRMGLKPGDRCTLYLPNSLDWIIAYFGVLKAGGVINPVNSLNTADEIEFIIKDCKARFAITSSDKAAPLLALKQKGVLSGVIVSGSAPEGAESFADLAGKIESRFESPAVSPRDLAKIGYTSGTTGRPKGAMMSHEAVILNAAMMAQMHVRTSSDTTVTALPLPHVYCDVVMNGAFQTGMTFVLHPRFVEADVLASITRHKATMFEGVPTMFMYLLNHPDLAKTDLSSLTRCTVGGQTMPLAKMQEVEERFGCPLIELWGMTELAGLGTTHPYYGKRKLGSIGIPMPYCEARIADPENAKKEMPAGEPGELLFRGPVTMLGYYGNDAATRETIEADGWLHTGDMATRDEDGFIFIVDRKKEMILTGGYNVYPAELERVIAKHTAVAMVAVGKQADALKGEVAKAYVVLKPGQTCSPDEIVALCKQNLAAYKVPRAVQFVADLPKTSTGKILRRELHTLDET